MPVFGLGDEVDYPWSTSTDHTSFLPFSPGEDPPHRSGAAATREHALGPSSHSSSFAAGTTPDPNVANADANGEPPKQAAKIADKPEAAETPADDADVPPEKETFTPSIIMPASPDMPFICAPAAEIAGKRRLQPEGESSGTVLRDAHVPDNVKPNRAQPFICMPAVGSGMGVVGVVFAGGMGTFGSSAGAGTIGIGGSYSASGGGAREVAVMEGGEEEENSHSSDNDKRRENLSGTTSREFL